MFAAIHSRIKLDDLIHGIIINSANDACIAIAEAMAGNENAFGAKLTKRAREIGLEKSTFTNATGYSDPNLRVTVRELAELARHIMQTYPEFYPLFSEREFTWNNIRQQNRNPLLAMGIGADGLKTGETSRGRVQPRRIGCAGGIPPDRRRYRREVREGTRRGGAQDARMGLPRFRGEAPVRRGPDGRRGQGLRRQTRATFRWSAPARCA